MNMAINMSMVINIVIPLMIAFFVTLIIGPFIISFLGKLKMKQTERTDGAKDHLAKAGTPTMGGIIILISLFLGSIFYVSQYTRMIPVLILTFGFGVIGFIDDYLKVVKKDPDGLKSLQKMILQIIVTAGFAVYLTLADFFTLYILIPFSGGNRIDIGWLAYVVMFIAVIGTVNGTNFTDGLDGLASSVTLVVAAFFTVVSFVISHNQYGWITEILPNIPENVVGPTVLWINWGVYPLGAAMIGALLGFLLFNCYPAKIFMGDTGSLALGGFVIGTAYVMEMPLFVIIVGFIYVIEVLSVMIQVAYFKMTKGKRVFKRTPIHHHFELDSEDLDYSFKIQFPKKGWSETRIVTVFTTITILLCLIAYMGVW